MKAKPEDLLHKLATGEDLLEKIDRLKKALQDSGYRCKIVRRKLAKGYRFYATIESKDPMDNLFVNQHQTVMRRILYKEFPGTLMTSGGGSSVTFALRVHP